MTTRYDGRPTVGFTASTTQFDDELIKRGIINHEQAIYRKGATSTEAQELAKEIQEQSNEQRLIYDIRENPLLSQQQRYQRQSHTNTIRSSAAVETVEESVSDNDDDFDFSDDDEFLQKYRQQRLAELQSESHNQNKGKKNIFGEVIPISRPDWTREVNDASRSVKRNDDDEEDDGNDETAPWVVVCLTHSHRTAKIEQSIHNLAAELPTTKFVTIPAHHAIPNWPESNLPSLFLYRHGSMQHELLRLPTDLTTAQVRRELENRMS